MARQKETEAETNKERQTADKTAFPTCKCVYVCVCGGLKHACLMWI